MPTPSLSTLLARLVHTYLPAGQPHRLESYQSSLLITGGISVTVGDTLVFLGVPLTLHVGTVYNVTITKKNPLAAVGASSTFFKGIMTRLGGGNENVDTSTVFTIVPGDTDLQPNQYCDSNVRVLAVRHHDVI